MHPIRVRTDEAYKASVEAIKEGKPVAWSMFTYWQSEPIYKAMDLEAVFPENYGAVCAAAGIGTNYLDRSDAEGFPTHLCGYSRVNYGYTARMMKDLKGEIPPEAPMGGVPKPALLTSDAWTCDARVKWFQALGHYMDVPVWTMETPTAGLEEFFMDGAQDNAVKLVVTELREFIAFLERLLGRRMDWDKYDETINDTIELSRTVHEINELRKVKPCPMHSRDFWSTMPSFYFMLGDLKEAKRLFQDMYDEVKYRVDNKIGAVEPEKYRLIFGELPPWHSLGFFDKLAERGWNFVRESWSYNPPIPLEGLEEIGDPIERHVRFHLQFNTGYYKMALEDKEYYGYFGYPYLVYARDHKCDGAFLHNLLTCRSASTHLRYVQDLLMRKAKIPSLYVEGDIVDLRLFDPEDALKQAEAFEETMEHYREVRKREGFDW